MDGCSKGVVLCCTTMPYEDYVAYGVDLNGFGVTLATYAYMHVCMCASQLT